MLYTLFLDRTTNLSVDELNTRLNDTLDDALVSDLGVIFYISGCPVAEQTLSDMLFAEQESIRFTAYCHLVRSDHISDLTYVKVHRFIQDPKNHTLIKDAHDRLWIDLN